MRFLKLTTALMMAFSCFCFTGCEDGAAPVETPAAEAGSGEKAAETGSGEKAAEAGSGEKAAEAGSGEKAAEGSDAK